MQLFNRLKNDCAAEWPAYVGHDFVRGMADGSLAQQSFRHYLVQDYLFLIQFARAHALAIYKAGSLEIMRESFQGLKVILETEMQLHLKLCNEWGLRPEEVEQMPEAVATVAYTRFVLDAGQAGDLLDLYTALAPCMIGYAEIGTALDRQAAADNPYRVWINEYASGGYQEIAANTRLLIDKLAAVSLTEGRYPKLLDLFKKATRLEIAFWQMGLDLSM
jgi:thiaminase (transcriptional activator TenA)